MEGQTLSHYRILERLGGGGMGVVYKALDTHLDRHVALKLLPPELAHDDDRERFVLEAKAASALDHPNICTIHDIDETPDGQMFIAMAHYEGETLKKRIERGPLPIVEALDIAIQVARGLEKAHESGIVHRDIKPANLMITKDGLVKIVDFGIAKLLGVTGRTQTGTMLGTVSYMSPEQLEGEDADQQSDVWSLGAVLYEMLTGQRPFRGESNWAVIAAISTGEPELPSSLRPGIPIETERIVTRALEKARESRYGSVAEFLQEAGLADVNLTRPDATSASPTGVWRTLLTSRLAIPTLLLVLAVGIWGVWSRRADAQWARAVAIPEIIRLVEGDEYSEAYALAEEAERYVPDDPILVGLWPQLSRNRRFVTTPPGADVYYKLYDEPEEEWISLGQTPLEGVRMPRGVLRIRIDREGFEPTNYVMSTHWEGEDPAFANIGLVAVEDATTGLTRVPLQEELWLELNGLTTHEVLRLPSYEIGTYEVTNAQFKEFVAAGGYGDERYWEHEFVRDGQVLSRQAAMGEFRDATGRPGPFTWEGGTYPAGQEGYPVRGISWYEAAAYAKFKGQSLPTAVHWVGAASPRMATDLVPFSNFGGEGPALTGSNEGMSWFGIYDVAGNVKEWVWNAVSSTEDRYILGGSWVDQTYKFFEIDYRHAFDRSADNGFRVAAYEDIDEIAELTLPIDPVTRDYREEAPVSDEIFEAYSNEYAYDATPFNEVRELVQDGSGRWVREQVTIDGAYDNQRLVLHLFLPQGIEPPYQTVVYFPGSDAISTPSVDSYDQTLYDFLVLSGRAVLFPVYDGTFERGNDRTLTFPDETAAYRDWIVHMVNDARRAVDYLMTRSEIQEEGLAYVGFSWGGQMGPLMLAMDPRFSAAVFVAGGLWNGRQLPQADPFNFAPRVSAPVLMVNGIEDAVFPSETSQKPLFNLLGSEEKYHSEIQAGHGISGTHRSQVVRETLEWLDRHLGPVN